VARRARWETRAMGKPYTLSREIIIVAPAEAVHPLLENLRAWQRWSPWEGLDPDLSRTYSGPERGVGARYAWNGNRKAGRGTMEITADSPERVELDLAVEKPFPSRSRVEFVLTPEGEETHVEWLMHGEMSLAMRAFAAVKPMDELIGPDLERGLAQLKAAAESDVRG
jgi:hypothetical protein